PRKRVDEQWHRVHVFRIKHAGLDQTVKSNGQDLGLQFAPGQARNLRGLKFAADGTLQSPPDLNDVRLHPIVVVVEVCKHKSGTRIDLENAGTLGVDAFDPRHDRLLGKIRSRRIVEREDQLFVFGTNG